DHEFRLVAILSPGSAWQYQFAVVLAYGFTGVGHCPVLAVERSGGEYQCYPSSFHCHVSGAALPGRCDLFGYWPAELECPTHLAAAVVGAAGTVAVCPAGFCGRHATQPALAL